MPPRLTVKETLNREGWLTELSRMALPLFAGFKLAQFRITMGWPSVMGLGTRARRVGECHGAKSSKGGVFELFISPVLEAPLEVAGTVLHEMAHVAAGIEAAHGPGFRKVCNHMGLTKGKPTQAMPGEHLAGKLEKFLASLGPYPHQAIVPTMKLVKPSQTVSLRCLSCDCRVSMSMKWLLEAGRPTCGCGGAFEDSKKFADEEDD